MAGNKEHAVTVKAEERVASLPVQEHWLPLSSLDLLLPAPDDCVFFCSKKPPADQSPETFTTMASALKTSPARVLVTYHPLAGNVVTISVGEPELLCNNRGVDFIEANANVKLVPRKKQGVLRVQL